MVNCEAQVHDNVKWRPVSELHDHAVVLDQPFALEGIHRFHGHRHMDSANLDEHVGGQLQQLLQTRYRRSPVLLQQPPAFAAEQERNGLPEGHRHERRLDAFLDNQRGIFS